MIAGDGGQHQRLQREEPDVGEQHALHHHQQLDDQHPGGQQRDPLRGEFGLDGVHTYWNRNVESSASVARMKAALSRSGTRNRRSLALVVSTSTTAPARTSSLATNHSSDSPMRLRAQIRRDAHREEDVHQQRHQHELLDRGAPLDQRQVAARVFEHHRLVNHRQLQVRGRVVHGDAARLGQQHDEQRGKGQHMRRVEQLPGRPLGGQHHLAEIGGAGGDGHGEDGQHQRRLGHGGDGHLAAAAHAAKGAGRVQSAQRQEEPSQGEQPDEGQHAAEQAQRRRRAHHRHHQPGQQRGDEQHVGHRPEDPGGVLGDHHVLAQELDQVQNTAARRAAPRRFCSLAFQFLMQPVSNGASASSRRVCRMMPRAIICSKGRKAEIRRPKAERSPKPEIRNPNQARLAGGLLRTKSILTPAHASAFGLRPSDFFRPSAFGFRVSLVHNANSSSSSSVMKM